MPDTRRRRPGVYVKPGAIRQARLEAGLSLAQVAAGRLTRNAIHLVETGRSRPSMETLELIAHATGRPVDYFLVGAPSAATEEWAGDQRALVELEGLVARGELDDAIAAGNRLLADAGPGEFAATVRLRLAEVHARLHDPDAALALLREARPALDAAGDEWLVIEALDWEAAAMHLLEDPRTIALLEEARARCHALDPVPVRLLTRVQTHLAMVHAARHAWGPASRAFESALECSTSAVDLLERAQIHTGLAHSYQEIGQPGKALTHASKAAAIYELQADLRQRAVAEGNLGDLLLKQGQLDDSDRHLRRALDHFDQPQVDQRGRGYVLWSLGEVELQRARAANALELGLEAVAAGQAMHESVVVAGGMQVVGSALEMLGRRDDADRQFEQALAILNNLDQPLRLRDAHMAYADLLERRGEVHEALRHWRTAAEIGRDAQEQRRGLEAGFLRATAG